MTTLYDFSIPALDGKSMIDFADFAGRPVMIVNTASKCGFTPQYEGLQFLWSRHGKNGLVIIGVPSNDFGGQEPGDNEEIGQTCYKNYGVSFPMAAKAHVRGTSAIPLFRWIASEGGFAAKPRWNFYKYLFSRSGTLETWFSPLTSPDGNRMRARVSKLLLA